MKRPNRNHLKTAIEKNLASSDAGRGELPCGALWRSGLSPPVWGVVQGGGGALAADEEDARLRSPALVEVCWERAVPRTGGQGRASCAPRSLSGWAARRRAGAAVAGETKRGEWAARSRAAAGLPPE